MSEPVNNVKVRTVSLYPRDWQIVHEVAKQTGVGNRSAALRVIIQEWFKTTQGNGQAQEMCMQPPT